MPENTLRAVEIFATGTWHASKGGKVTVTGDDLDAMVASFQAINTELGFKPSLKLGHKEMHRFFGGDKGAPSLGFVENVRRIGDKIVADFVNLPSALFDLVRAGRYTQVSIEMMGKAAVAGKEFKNVLTAVALLGAELPAVKGLKDLRDALLSDGGDTIALEGETFELTQEEDEPMPEGTTYNQEQHDALRAKAVEEALGKAQAEFAAEKATLTSQVEALTTRAETAEGALQAFQTAKRDADVEVIVDGAIKAGKWLPKHRDVLLAQGKAQAQLTKFGADEKDGLEAFKAFAETLPKVVSVDVETGAEGGDAGDAKGKTSAAAELSAATNKIAVERKLDYGQAFSAALSEASAELRQRYLKGE